MDSRPTPQASHASSRLTRLWGASLALLAFGTLTALLSRTQADPDLWGHLRFGLDLLESGSLTTVDPYSYLTAGHGWINHEWLAEAAFALAWKLGGSAGLVALKVGLLLMVFGAVYWQLAALGVRRSHSLILLALLLVFVTPAAGTVRPHMFTILLFALTLLVIVRGELRQYGWLWAAPAIFALWINFHGGVLAGVGIFVIWSLVHGWLNPGSWRRILPPLAAAPLVCLLNPYVTELPLFLLRTATVARPEISEWKPLVLTSALGLFFLMTLVLSVTALIFSRRPRNLTTMVLFGVAALLPFMAERHLPLFALTTFVFCGEHIGDVWSRNFKRIELGERGRVWLALPVAAAGVLMLSIALSSFSRIPIRAPFPLAAVSLLKQSGVAGNLAVDFTWGQYVIWHLGPRVQVSMDGRRETVYPDEIYRQNLEFMFGVGDWDVLLTEHPTELVLANKGFAAYNLVSLSPGWDLVFEDSISALFVPRGSPLLDPLRNAAARITAPPGQPYFP